MYVTVGSPVQCIRIFWRKGNEHPGKVEPPGCQARCQASGTFVQDVLDGGVRSGEGYGTSAAAICRDAAREHIPVIAPPAVKGLRRGVELPAGVALGGVDKVAGDAVVDCHLVAAPDAFRTGLGPRAGGRCHGPAPGLRFHLLHFLGNAVAGNRQE